MSVTLDPYLPEFTRAIEFLTRELVAIHTGRATPVLVEDIAIDAYGATMTVRKLASITVTDPRTLTVEPWDLAILKDIERGIRTAQSTLNPVNDGRVLRIPMPQLTEETRRNLTKLIGQKVESAKQVIRQVRDRARSAILDAERANAITEDDRFRLQKKLDELTEERVTQLKALGEHKIAEVMTV